MPDMAQKGIILLMRGFRLFSQLKQQAMRAYLQQVTRCDSDGTTDTPTIEQHAVEAFTVCKIHLSLVPGYFGVITRSHIIIQPDVVLLPSPYCNNRTFQ